MGGPEMAPQTPQAALCRSGHPGAAGAPLDDANRSRALMGRGSAAARSPGFSYGAEIVTLSPAADTVNNPFALVA
jgi:hypothetical protein